MIKNCIIDINPWWLKESTCNEGDIGDVDLIPGSGSSPGGGNSNLLQYSCLRNLMDRGARWALVQGSGRTAGSASQFAVCPLAGYSAPLASAASS